MTAFARAWLFTCAHERPTLAVQLADCRAELRTSERRRATLKEQAAHYIDQAIRARTERDRAEVSFRRLLATSVEASDCVHACLTAAIDRNVDLVTRILVLEGEAETFARERETLTVIAEGLRDELREVRAGLAVGALRRTR